MMKKFNNLRKALKKEYKGVILNTQKPFLIEGFFKGYKPGDVQENLGISLIDMFQGGIVNTTKKGFDLVDSKLNLRVDMKAKAKNGELVGTAFIISFPIDHIS